MRVCCHVLHVKVPEVLYDRLRVLYCDNKGNGISFSRAFLLVNRRRGVRLALIEST